MVSSGLVGHGLRLQIPEVSPVSVMGIFRGDCFGIKAGCESLNHIYNDAGCESLNHIYNDAGCESLNHRPSSQL